MIEQDSLNNKNALIEVGDTEGDTEISPTIYSEYLPQEDGNVDFEWFEKLNLKNSIIFRTFAITEDGNIIKSPEFTTTDDAANEFWQKVEELRETYNKK